MTIGIVRKSNLSVTTPRYGFVVEGSFLMLTMDQVSDALAAGLELVTVGVSRQVWGVEILFPEHR